ncbi:MAG: beta-ketoacyl-ACP synthase 3 [Thermoleophilia bacterium]|nr:beta-ketoacyl-ACP synthase 3 [Thermoleophilia bacterium]
MAEPGPLEAGLPDRRTASIASIGTALPPTSVSTDSIAGRLGIDPDWIVQRTGIRERRIAGSGESLTALAAEAGRRALAAGGVDAADLDLVLVATFSADRVLPNAAPLVADELGARGAFACDIGAACTGFLSALALASAQIESGRADQALVIGADFCSRLTDQTDRKTAGLFADGAGAVVVGAGGEGRLGRMLLRSDARQADCIVVEHAERLIRMRGQDTFRAAVDALSEITIEVLAADGAEVEDIDLFVYHQANARITRAVGERLALPPERVVDCIELIGNTSAATLPLALDHAAGQGRLQPGSRVLMAAFGAGLAWGAGLMSWHGEVAT